MSSVRGVAEDGTGQVSRASGWTGDELVSETRCGAGLARALIEHVHRMGVSGYSDEVVVNGEPWVVTVAPKQPAV